MKRHITLLMLFLLLFSFSCSNVINDATPEQGKEQITANNTDTAKFKYLQYLYQEEAGKTLNKKVLEGRVYETYPEDVQRLVNIMLRFPLRKPTTATGDGNKQLAVSNLPADWLDQPWWESLPEEIREGITQTGSDIIADGLAEGLTQFLESEEGQALVESYLDDVEGRLQNLVDYALDEFEAQYEDEVNMLLLTGGVIAASEAVTAGVAMYSAITGAVGVTINPFASMFTAASMIQSHFQHKAMMKNFARIMQQLAVIQQLLEEIQVKLDRIEAKIDTILGYTIDIAARQKYEQAKKARLLLDTIQQQMAYLNDIDNTQLEENIKTLLTDMSENGFEYILYSAFEAANETQLWAVDEGLIEKNSIENIVIKRLQVKHILIDTFLPIPDPHWRSRAPFYVNLLEPTELSPIQYKIELPSTFVTIEINGEQYALSYADIILMIKLSRLRMSLAELVFEGEELLQFRKRVAENDLLHIFNPIEQAIDNAPPELENALEEYSSVSFPAYDAEQFYVYILFYNGEAQYIVNPYPNHPSDDHSILNEKIQKLTGGYGLKTTSIEEMDKNLYELLETEYYNQTNMEAYVVHCKALLATWKITLEAHIAAGTDL